LTFWRFTNRIIIKHSCVRYHQSLAMLGLGSSELRRLRADILLTYKHCFRIITFKVSDFFILYFRRPSR